MEDLPTRLDIEVDAGPDADADEVAGATATLRRELLELDVDVQHRPGSEAPPGARAIDPVTLGGLVVTVASSPLVSAVVAAVRTWLAGERQRSIALSIDGDRLELTGLSSAEQVRLADEWLARHTAGGGDDG